MSEKVDDRPFWKKKLNWTVAGLILSKGAMVQWPEHEHIIAVITTAVLALVGLAGVSRLQRYAEAWFATRGPEPKGNEPE